MKQIFVTLFLLFYTAAFAQKIETAKDLLRANKIADAKKEIDAVLAVEKNQKNAEAFYTKAKIYNRVSQDAILSRQFPGARAEAFNALKKYTEMDDKMLISLQIDGYTPINEIYTGYYQDAATSFNAKDYSTAFTGFTNAIIVSTFMNQKGWIKLPLDTNSVLYAGVAAEKMNHLPDAVKYYGLLVENKVTGEGFVEIYKWVANYHYENKDEALAKKFLQIGKEVFPADPFWMSLELDMARDNGDKTTLYSQYEKAIMASPDNHLYRYNYSVELYQYAYNMDKAKRPANSEELITKALGQLKEVLRLAPNYSRAQLFNGQIFYNQGVDLLNISKATTDEQKKKEFKAAALKKFNDAIPFFQKTEQLLAGGTGLKKEDKSDLLEAFDLLITIYDQRGEKEKVKEYETKFNALSK